MTRHLGNHPRVDAAQGNRAGKAGCVAVGNCRLRRLAYRMRDFISLSSGILASVAILRLRIETAPSIIVQWSSFDSPVALRVLQHHPLPWKGNSTLDKVDVRKYLY